MIKRFDSTSGRDRALASVRKILNIRPPTPQVMSYLQSRAQEAALVKLEIADIINVMLEELVRQRYELPAFSILDRIAGGAREQANNKYLLAISTALSSSGRRLVDSLMTLEGSEGKSRWQALKREPKRLGNKETREYLAHVEGLSRIVRALPKLDLPPAVSRFYRNIARSSDATEMATFKPAKRYALAVVYLRWAYSQALDDAADMFIRLVQNMESNAHQRMIDAQLDRTEKAHMLVEQLRSILWIMQSGGGAASRMESIEASLVADPETLLAACEEVLAVAGRSHLQFLVIPYKSLRSQLLNCLEVTRPVSTSADATMEFMIAALLLCRNNRSHTVALADLGLDASDMKWLPPSWRKLVFVVDGSEDSILDRKFFELAVIMQVKQDLKSGDLCIPESEKYSDYREQLVEHDLLEEELDKYGEVTGIETEPAEFVQLFKEKLHARALVVDEAFPENLHAEIDGGRLVLRKPMAEQPP